MSGPSESAATSALPAAASASVVQAPASAESGATAARPAARLSEQLPLRRDDASIWKTDGVHPFFALSIVLALAMVCTWFMWRRKQSFGAGRTAASAAAGVSGNWMSWRRWTLPGKPGEFRVLQSTRLGPRASLHLVEWQGRQLLVGCTEQTITTLDRAPLPDKDAEPAPMHSGAVHDA